MIIVTVERDGKTLDVVGVQDSDGRVHPTRRKVVRVGKVTLQRVQALQREREKKANPSFLEESASFVAWMLCLVPLGVIFVTNGWTWVSFMMIPVFIIAILAAIVVSSKMDDRARGRRIEYGNRIDEVLHKFGLHYYEIQFEDDSPVHAHHTLLVA